MRRTRRLRVPARGESQNVVIDGGWIPPAERTRAQRALHEEFERRLVPFAQAVSSPESLPSQALHFKLQQKVIAKLLLEIWQSTGSCVGAAAGGAYADAMTGDVAHRGDREEIKLPCFLPTYGVGRQIGGFRRKGEGSFGGSQAKAVETFGMLPIDHPKMPKPQVVGDGKWVKYSSAVEYQWSHPSYWPVPYNELKEEADDFVIKSKVKITSVQQARELTAQGFGITLASSFGTRPRIRNGMLIGTWNGTWQHQMRAGGYSDADDPERPDRGSNGNVWMIRNQWGPNGHNINCPWLETFGIRGCFWISDDTFARIIRNGEVYGHSNTAGFPLRKINWRNLGFPMSPEGYTAA